MEATDGETAIEKFRQDPTFDTVLVDIGLDKMDGVQVCAEIKSISKPTRVIVMSGLISQERMKEIEAAGADGVLPKPFQMPALFDVLKPRD
ncbi:MAG: two-component system, chemotaxis family, chemotaxis protein CheY [Candidatus Parcubacteria bacterium]|nr:two-component system, chemotaxis family, chemotaxis protein CheY [Candidatus Parcubacteria bacterium]